MGKRQQTSLKSAGLLPDIKEKDSAIGKQINVMGSFWEGTAAAEKKKDIRASDCNWTWSKSMGLCMRASI